MNIARKSSVFSSSFSSQRWLEAIALLAIVAIACFRVIGTYHEISATYDEPNHIYLGLMRIEAGSFAPFLDNDSFTSSLHNPPLVPIVVAAGAWLSGLRPTSPDLLLHEGAGYQKNLTLARTGVLPFLALAIVLVWWWSRRLGGGPAGLLGAAMFSTLPPVLGHGGLATTDIPFTALFLAALLMFIAYLEHPSHLRAALLGIAMGLSFAAKFSTILLVPTALALFLLRRIASRHEGVPMRRLALDAAISSASAFAIIWAVYGFTWGLLGPMPELLRGLSLLAASNQPGQRTAYLLGRINQKGFFLFYPVALLVKTPMPFLVFAGIGFSRLLDGFRRADWQRTAPAVAAAVYLLAVLPSRINLGVRHVLPVYAFLAVLAAPIAINSMVVTRNLFVRAGSLIAILYLLLLPSQVTPDFFPYFNCLAGRHPEQVLLDSDLDWGQDLLRLRQELSARGVNLVHIALFGVHDPCRHGLPPSRWLRPHERVTGWIAISEMYRRGVAGFHYRNGDPCDRTQFTPTARPDPTQFSWLDAYEPEVRVGKSILLYHINEGPVR